jgi:hypothetical protein
VGPAKSKIKWSDMLAAVGIIHAVPLVLTLQQSGLARPQLNSPASLR